MASLARRIIGRITRDVSGFIDYLKYRQGASSYKSLCNTDKLTRSMLIVSGRGMNVVWAQIWSIYSIAMCLLGYKRYVVTSRKHRNINRYYSFLGISLLFFEDIIDKDEDKLDPDTLASIDKLNTFNDFGDYHYMNMPAGQIALSTYSRHRGTGSIKVEDESVRSSVKEWIVLICESYNQAQRIYEEYSVEALFFTEVFMEEYGAYYYAALSKNLNVMRFAGTVRDNAIIIQHLGASNDRTHHASISCDAWEALKAYGITQRIRDELEQNFRDRYGTKWHRSSRNHPDTTILTAEAAKDALGIDKNRKVAIVFSHILYDTLFFFGTDLYSSYADWLINTVKTASKNDSVDWLIKVHPSNIWRGELDSLLKGQYEEERLIHSVIKELPPHVRIISPDTEINPYSWFQLGDYCITVRGTSGLEMAALGKTVITAGTGRYNHNGFTCDPATREEYEDLLLNLNKIPPLSDKQHELAQLYAHALFCRKPFEMHSMNARLKTGKKKMVASDDIIYMPKKLSGDLPKDIMLFKDWVEKTDVQDLLT